MLATLESSAQQEGEENASTMAAGATQRSHPHRCEAESGTARAQGDLGVCAKTDESAGVVRSDGAQCALGSEYTCRCKDGDSDADCEA